MRKYIIFFILIIAVCRISTAGPSGTADTVKAYRLGEIIVNSDKEIRYVSPTTIDNVTFQTIKSSDVSSVSELGAYIPSGFIQTNSRGESLLFLRGAAERQTNLFLDGVPMNLPWDNRMDLSVVPANIIGNIAINKGAGSILYGANTLGGAVNFNTIERKSMGMGIDLSYVYNNANSNNISLSHDYRMGKFNYIVNLGYLKSDGFLLSEDAEGLIHQIADDDLRTNTDQERYNAYFRAEYEASDATTLAISLNHFNAEKGVAPEAHIEDARFWRYPLLRRTLVALNGEHVFSEKNSQILRASVWFDKFDQEIDYYDDITFSNINDNEMLDETNMGARLTFLTEVFGEDVLTFAFTGFMSDNMFESKEEGSFDYLQATYSTGLEYQKYFGNFRASAGVSMDGNSCSKEDGADVIDEGDLTNWSPNIGLKYFLTENTNIFAAFANKTRFPTLREKYSTGGGKFVINPDLGPETGMLTDFGAEFKLSGLFINIAFFANYYDDMIAKGKHESGKKVRINIDKSRIIGFETSFSYSPVSRMDLIGHITYLDAKKEEDGSYVGGLEYIPELMANLVAKYKFDCRLTPQIEFEYTGKQGAENDQIEAWDDIGPTVIMNFRLAYQYVHEDIFVGEIFVRLNNIFDEYKLSKFGIPEPGRMLSTGINFSL